MTPLCLWCGEYTSDMFDGSYYCGGRPPPIKHQYRVELEGERLFVGDFLVEIYEGRTAYYRIDDFVAQKPPIRIAKERPSVEELKKIFATLNNFQ